jgi:hypothetical protein
MQAALHEIGHYGTIVLAGFTLLSAAALAAAKDR